MSTDNERIRTVLLDTEKLLSVTFSGRNFSVAEERSIQSILGKIKALRESCPELKLGPDEEDIYEDTESTPQIPYKGTPTAPQESVPPTNGDNSSENNDEYSDSVTAVSRSVAEFPDPPKKGFLKVKGSGLFGYTSKFFVAAESLLFMYDKETSKRQSSTIILKGYEARPSESKKKSKEKTYDFELVKPASRTHSFRAASEDDLQKWIFVLNKQSKFNPRPEVILKKTNDPKKKEKDVAEKNNKNTNKELPPIPTNEENPKDATSINSEEQPIEEELYEVAEDIRPSVPPAIKKSTPPPRRPLPQPEETVEEDDEIYDEAESGVPIEEDDELYDDGSSVPQPPAKDLLRKTQVSKRVQPSGAYDNKGGISPDTNGADFGEFYYCKYDCFTGGKDELKFNKGDIVLVFSKEYEGQGWMLAELEGQKGFIPKTYIEPAYELVS